MELLAEYYSLEDGEWGMRANDVSSNGMNIDYSYNIYKSQTAGELSMVSQNQSATYYIDNNIASDIEYCYSVTASSEYINESDLSSSVCYDTGTVYELITASVTFAADLSELLTMILCIIRLRFADLGTNGVMEII